MRKLLFILLFTVTVTQAQTPYTAVKSCCGVGIFTPPADHKAVGQGDFPNGFSFRQWYGDYDHWYTLTNTSNEVYGGAPPATGVTQEGIGATNGANYIDIHGAGPLLPLRVRGNNGIQIPARPDGTRWRIDNVVIFDNGAAGVTANFDSVAGYYASEYVTRARGFNLRQELFYGGATHKGYAEHRIGHYNNNFSYNIRRNADQFEHYDYLQSLYGTYVKSTQSNEQDQDAELQAHDLGTGSEIGYKIYDGGGRAFNIFCHGLRVHDNLFRFDKGSSYIGDFTTTYLKNGKHFSGDTLFIEGNKFDWLGPDTLAALTVIAERYCPIVFRNNTFSYKIKAIYILQQDAGATNAIIGTIGTYGNRYEVITPPVYVKGYNDPDQPLVHGLLSPTSVYYGKWGYYGWGNLTN